MSDRRTWWLVAAAGIVAAAELTASAQNNMPFSQTYRRPSVSPYTMLATSGVAGMGPGGAIQGTFNPLVYQQLVQPREDQERQYVSQMMQGQQINSLQNRVQMIQRDTTARQVNEEIRPTGHMATFLNMSHYYPMQGR